MTKGYFIRLGDKTTCGGTVLSACDCHYIHGVATARMGDKVTCGKNPGKIYHLEGGIPNYIIMGVPAAGTLHTTSTCPCKSRLIPSSVTESYGVESVSKVKPKQSIQSQPAKKLAQDTQPNSEAPSSKTSTPKPTETPREAVDAGFCIVPLITTPGDYEPYLFVNSPEGTKELYQVLNPQKSKKAGSILIIADPLKNEPKQIKHLENARDRIDEALAPLTNEQANFLYKHKDIIDVFSSLSGDSLGLVSGMAKDYFSQIENTLIQIQNTYRNQYITYGALIGEQFFVERNNLFKKLDGIFLKIFRSRIGLAPFDEMRSALRLSSSSIIHRWNQTGVSDIEGYATYIERSAKLVKMMNGLNKIGIGFSALNGINSIYDACTVGQDCEKTSYTEVGKFTGGVALPIVTAGIIRAGTTAACAVVLGAISAPAGGAGALACSIIVTGASGFVVGKVGESGGAFIGEEVYNIFN